MSPEIIAAGAILLALIAYAVLAGADFGGGIWDLFATRPRISEQRAAIAHAMGPVWEANHVWLIFVIVLLFSCFPRGFEGLSIALYVPFHLVLLGIILRGAAFVFRAYARSEQLIARSTWGVVFGVASVITPILLGMCLGAVSESRAADEAGFNWVSLFTFTFGMLALAQCAYLAAIYVANEVDGILREDFRTRALLSGTVVVALSVALLPLLRTQAPHLWSGLLGKTAAPVLVIGIIAALTAGLALRYRFYRLARTAAVAQVMCLLAGWGIAQFPYIIYPTHTLHEASPTPTIRFILISLVPGLALLLPSLWWLFRIFKGEHLGLIDTE